MAFDKARYDENNQRKTALREMHKVPYGINEYLINLLSTNATRSDYFRTCITCEHWKEEKCTLYNVVPPVKVIVDGCDQYKDFDEVPF